MRDVDVQQVPQDAHGLEADVSHPGTLGGVEAGEARGAATQSLPADVSHARVSCMNTHTHRCLCSL